MGPVQYKWATLPRLRKVYARLKLRTAQQRLKTYLDRKASFLLILNAENFLLVDKLRRALIEAERQKTRHSKKNTADALGRLLLKYDGSSCIFLPTGTLVHIVLDGFTTSVRNDRLTMVLTGLRAL